MAKNYRSVTYDTKDFHGQFLLTAGDRELPERWTVHQSGPWRLATMELAVIDVCDAKQQWLGWCIGHPIVDGRLHPQQVVLQAETPEALATSIETFYERASGKWILFLLQGNTKQVFLDTYGSLSLIYSTIEKTVASTSTLLGSNHPWNDELIQAIGLPESDTWLPSGLTTRKNVRRLLPNHTLNLNDWTVGRHWPTVDTDLTIRPNTQDSVAAIVSTIKKTINAVAEHYPVCFSVTAGRDSRMLLACARGALHAATFFTFAEDAETLDMKMATLISQRYKLKHRFIPIKEATPSDMESWQELTGLSVSGYIRKIHKTLEQLDPGCVLLPGMGGEVGRAFYWKSGDRSNTKITAQDVLTRCKLPQHSELVKATEAWIAELPFVDAFALLDLVYIEQRLGCWAAPQHYGNTTSAFEMTPFNSRPVFQNMMRLPHAYRWHQQLAKDVCQYAWPELLNFPFNEYTGVKGYFYSNAKRMKKLIKNVIGR